jgi:hypothetical protein
MFSDGTHDMTPTRPGITRRPGQVHFRIQYVQFTALTRLQSTSSSREFASLSADQLVALLVAMREAQKSKIPTNRRQCQQDKLKPEFALSQLLSWCTVALFHSCKASMNNEHVEVLREPRKTRRKKGPVLQNEANRPPSYLPCTCVPPVIIVEVLRVPNSGHDSEQDDL